MEVRDNRSGFLWVGNAVLDNFGHQLGAYGIAVYVGLARFASNDGSCYPSIATLATLIGVSERQVQRSLADLAALNLIQITPRLVDGVQRSNIYTLLTPGDSQSPEGCQIVTGGVTDRRTEQDLMEQDPKNNTETHTAAKPPRRTVSKGQQPSPSGSAREPNHSPPGSEPPPRQPHVAIIDAWRDALNGDAPITTNPYGGQYGKVAVAIARAGITPDQVKAYTLDVMADPFWKGKVIPLENVAKNIKRWLRGSSYGTSQQSIDHPGNPGTVSESPAAARPVSTGIDRALIPRTHYGKPKADPV